MKYPSYTYAKTMTIERAASTRKKEEERIAKNMVAFQSLLVFAKDPTSIFSMFAKRM